MSKKKSIGISAIIIAVVLILLLIFVLRPEEPATAPDILVTYEDTDITDETENFDLGTVSVGAVSNYTFTIENLGDGDLELTDSPNRVKVTGTGYSLKDNTGLSIIPASSSTTFNISFTSDSSGSYIGFIAIENNDVDEDPYNFTVVIHAGYSHNIVIDGINDFYANETFSTTSVGYTGYMTWDDTYVYVGMNGADISLGSQTKWILIYIGGAGGTTTGKTYTTQTPNLPFELFYHVSWRGDGVTTGYVYAGLWVSAGWDFSGDTAHIGNFVEMRIPRADIGSPTTSLKVHMNMIDSYAATESTYAGVPNSSFTDGYDRDYAQYYDFNLNSTTAPGSYAPL